MPTATTGRTDLHPTMTAPALNGTPTAMPAGHLLRSFDGYAMEKKSAGHYRHPQAGFRRHRSIVLATSSEGEGTFDSGLLKPSVTTRWARKPGNDLGRYLHSLWVDNQGQVREHRRLPAGPAWSDRRQGQDSRVLFRRRNRRAKFKRFDVDSDGEKVVNYVDTMATANSTGTAIYRRHGNGVYEGGET